MNLTFSLYFLDEFEILRKIDEYIVNKEDIILEYGVGKDYASLTFDLQNIDIPQNCIADKERIFFKFKIDNNIEKQYAFIIDNIDFLPHDIKKIYCKSRSYLKSDKYSSITKNISADDFYALLDVLYKNIEIIKNCKNYRIVFDVEANGKSASEIAIEYTKLAGIEVYWYNNKVFFEDKKAIKKDDIPVFEFNEIEHIVSFSTSTNKDSVKISKVIINAPDDLEEEITSEADMKLSINPDPCVSPTEPLVYTDDDGNNYTIAPQPVRLELYYNPLSFTPQTSFNMTKTEKILIEEFELNEDFYIVLTAGIKEILGVSGDFTINDINYKQDYNIVYFNEAKTGKIRLSYKTDILVHTIQPQTQKKTFKFKAEFFDKVIENNIKFDFKGYLPLNAEYEFDCVGDFGLDYADAVNASFAISRYDKNNDVFIEIGNIQADATGMLRYVFTEYGIYKLGDNIFIEFFVNSLNFYKGQKQYSEYYG